MEFIKYILDDPLHIVGTVLILFMIFAGTIELIKEIRK